MFPSLRPYQAKVVDEAVSGDLVVLATGLGKSVIMAELAVREVAKGARVLAVAHTNELIGQLSEKFRAAWLDPERTVWVRSIQELRKSGGPPSDVVLLDEAHHFAADDWNLLLSEQYSRADFYGFTATPERGDGRGMGGAGFRRILSPISISEAISAGYLVKPEVLRPERALGPGELADDPVKAYSKYAAGTKAIAFHPSVHIAIQTACEMRDAGIRAAAIWGDMPLFDRKRVVQQFRDGALDVLTSVEVLTEGFDVPETDTVMLARGYGCRGRLMQACGRAMRPAKDKTRALIIDLRGVTHTFGDPDEDVTYHLDGKAIRRAVDDIDVKFCPVCGSPVMGPACETCGHSGEMRMRKPRVLGLPLDRFARVRQDDTEARAARLARWLRDGKAKGHKEGAAKHKFKAVYGDFPTYELMAKARAT